MKHTTLQIRKYFQARTNPKKQFENNEKENGIQLTSVANTKNKQP